jgi:hypothetical protein
VRRGLVLAAVAAVQLLAPPAAGAQSDAGGFVLIGLGGATPVGQTQLPVAVSGSLSVEFEGTPQAGCDRHGLCGVSGTTLWDPGHSALLSLQHVVIGGKHKLIGGLLFEENSSVTKVSRPGPGGTVGLCGDAGTADDLGSLDFQPGYSFSLRLTDATSDITASHCASPLQSDILKLLPVRPLRHALMRHGRGTIDLSTTRPFSSGGFSGVLRSTVKLRIGRPLHVRLPSFLRSVRHKTVRYRVSRAHYRISRLDGRTTTTFGGLPEQALCLPLDTCGVSGTLSQSVPHASGSFDFSVLTRASRPKLDSLKALGLSSRGNARGIHVDGGGFWVSGSATTTSAVTHNDGSTPCTDTVPVHGGFIGAGVRGRRLIVSYESDGFHTRCPGPLQQDLLGEGAFASGSIPVSALGRRSITVRLTQTASIADPALAGSIQPELTLTLTRVKVDSKVIKFREPA